jgi:hypothetical protein
MADVQLTCQQQKGEWPTSRLARTPVDWYVSQHGARSPGNRAGGYPRILDLDPCKRPSQ